MVAAICLFIICTSIYIYILLSSRGEFESDGMVVLKGKELEKFKKEIGLVQSEPNLVFAPNLSILVFFGKLSALSTERVLFSVV